MQLKNEGKAPLVVTQMKDEGWIKAHWQADKAGIKLISIQGSKTH